MPEFISTKPKKGEIPATRATFNNVSSESEILRDFAMTKKITLSTMMRKGRISRRTYLSTSRPLTATPNNPMTASTKSSQLSNNRRLGNLTVKEITYAMTRTMKYQSK